MNLQPPEQDDPRDDDDMKLPIGTPVLSMDSPTFSDDLAKAMGVKPGDTIEIMTPQFERTDGEKVGVPAPVADPAFWKILPQWSDADLKAIGMQVWDINEKGTLYLIPYQWYDHIPEGTELTCIDGKPEVFAKGITDDDRRFGCLAYGVLK